MSPPSGERAPWIRILLAPAERLEDPSLRRTAVLFAGCLLALLLLFGCYDVFLVVTREGYVPPWPGYLAMGTAYVSLRLGFYKPAAYLTLSMFPIVAFALVVTGTAPVPVTTLTFPVLAVLLATLLLDARGTAIITAGTAVLIVLTTVIGPHRLDISTVAGPLLTVVLGGAIAVLSIIHRTGLEQSRRAALESTALELEGRVAERTSELARTVAELESFSYSVSHDLRSPLRAIEGLATILVEDHGERLDADGHEIVGSIRSSAGRTSHMVDSLLELARVARGPVQRRDVDLVALSEEVLQSLRLSDPSRELAFERPPALRVHADPILVRSVIENLIGNAWKFTGHTPEPRIELGSAPRDGATWIYLRDNGTGFAMEHAAQLFRPFERLHADEFPGTGIGLATVHRILSRHGGSIVAESRPCEGATFWFHFGDEEHLQSTNG